MEELANYIRKRVAISDHDLKEILSRFQSLKVRKKEILLREGGRSDKMYFVLKGCIRIYFIKENGSEVTRRIIFENDSSSSLTSFITGEPSSEYIQAVTASELLYLSREDFYYLVDKLPVWESYYRKNLEIAYVINTKRLMSFLTQDATERYRLLLEENPEIVQRLPNKLVANYLNITQEALSRLKGKL